MTFIDTNAFVYSIDCRDIRKQATARAILQRAFAEGDCLVSTQVLNEFSNVALKKLHLTEGEVMELLDVFGTMRIVPAQAHWTRRALELKRECGIQFYDALMIAAAEAHGCETILSEDLNDGQSYAGVKAVNPFRAQSAGDNGRVEMENGKTR